MKTRIDGFLTNDRVDSRDHACFESASKKRLVDQIDCCGLAIRTCHTNDSERAGREPTKSRGDVCHRLARVFHTEIWNLASRYVLSPNYCDSASLHRISNVFMSIRRSTFKSNKKEPLFYFTGIKTDTLYFDIFMDLMNFRKLP